MFWNQVVAVCQEDASVNVHLSQHPLNDERRSELVARLLEQPFDFTAGDDLQHTGMFALLLRQSCPSMY